MNKKSKYLSLFIMLAFVVGQVQYTYTSYFCKMLEAYVPPQSVSYAAQQGQDGESCDQCQAPYSAERGNQVLEANCFQINTIQKGVVGSFVVAPTPDLHAASAFVFVLPRLVLQSLTVQNCLVVSAALSPPPDIPTLNSSLLI